VASTLAVLYACLGLLVVPFFYIISRITPTPTAPSITGVGMGFIIAMPFLYAFLGLVTGYVGSVLYNWVASLTGGIVFEDDEPIGRAA
jgi:hypothetical protein